MIIVAGSVSLYRQAGARAVVESLHPDPQARGRDRWEKRGRDWT